MKRNAVWIAGHLLAVVAAFIALSTGLRVAILTRSEVYWLSPLLPQGLLHHWHFMAGVILSGLLVAYLLSRFFSPTKNPRKTRLSARYHRYIHRYGDWVFVTSVITGWLNFFDQHHLLPTDLHWYSALAMCLYVLLHGVVYFIEFGNNAFRRILKPATSSLSFRLIGFSLVWVIAVVGVWWTWVDQPSSVLEIHPMSIKTLVNLDGHADEDIWSEADEIQVMTQGGANFGDGKTPVTIKAVHNGIDVFFYIRWHDETRSLKHLPLKKTEQGWQVQQDGFYQFDEQTFYEDKFAVMLSNHCGSGAAGTAHMGPKPLADKPTNWHGKGYHYSEDNTVHDLWHWKAVRTNSKQQADDNYIGPPMAVYAGERRYTAGYNKDAKESGGYVMNWSWYKPDYIVPKRLPIDRQILAPFQVSEEGDKQYHDTIDWLGTWFDYQPYKAELDDYPVGTQMPSVLYRSNQFEGDRGNVRAVGIWSDNHWSLEMARRLDTGSDKDIRIEDGICLWVAAFDHSQIGHTRHHQALKVQVVKP